MCFTYCLTLEPLAMSINISGGTNQWLYEIHHFKVVIMFNSISKTKEFYVFFPDILNNDLTICLNLDSYFKKEVEIHLSSAGYWKVKCCNTAFFSKTWKCWWRYWSTRSCKLVIRQVATFSTASKHKIA